MTQTGGKEGKKKRKEPMTIHERDIKSNKRTRPNVLDVTDLVFSGIEGESRHKPMLSSGQPQPAPPPPPPTKKMMKKRCVGGIKSWETDPHPPCRGEAGRDMDVGGGGALAESPLASRGLNLPARNSSSNEGLVSELLRQIDDALDDENLTELEDREGQGISKKDVEDILISGDMDEDDRRLLGEMFAGSKAT